ncbi:MAG: HPr family phosphocarrier protein [Oscillospiraceae bacterium]|nr:HPr family phosphocarrier protein [Oscillospiraceae bacterium]
MKQFTYTITDSLGIHARPAGMLAKLAKSYGPDTTATLTKGEKTVKLSQLMMLMGLAVKQGQEVTVAVEGPQEEEACAALEAFFKENL